MDAFCSSHSLEVRDGSACLRAAGRLWRQEEDDGVVMSVVTGGDGTSFLLTLDARTFKVDARARVPYGFHCAFSPRNPGDPAAMGKT